MRTSDWLKNTEIMLKSHDVPTARLDALVLLEDQLNTNRAHLLAHPEIKLTPVQITVLDEMLARRAAHVPLAYIRGKTEFYGRDFTVNEHVLEPRPESETMITLLKQLSLKQQVKLADIGSGSGALGITAALELGLDTVYLHDIDPKTLEVAKKNAEMHNVRVVLLQDNLINNYNADYEILLCNLPYVPDSFHINTAATHEPKIAIFGGPDGLDLYREMFVQIANLPFKPRYILTESLPPQHEELAHIAADAGYQLLQSEDFIQVFSPDRSAQSRV
ncbi:MAG: HemK/PrmC family methyltransferase [Candidatus Saccharimonadales bacterium]